jgi:lipid-binding SYLF domain-containing protein
VLIVPQRNPHRTRADLAVPERYLIVAKSGVHTSDKHNSRVHHIFHIAAGPAAVVEAPKGAAALSCLINYFLRHMTGHCSFSISMGLFAGANVAGHCIYYTVTMQSNYFCVL